MIEVDEIIKYVKLYWDRHQVSRETEESKINDMTSKLYSRLKEDHTKFNNAYPVLLFTFARGIFHRDSVLKYFDDVRRNGLGDDTKQAMQLARYTAHAVAEINRSRGFKVTKKMIKEHKHKVYENIVSIKKDFSTAMEEIKKQRTEDAQGAGAKRQEQDAKLAEESEKLKEETYNVFKFGNLSETNETFRKSKEARMHAKSVSQ